MSLLLSFVKNVSPGPVDGGTRITNNYSDNLKEIQQRREKLKRQEDEEILSIIKSFIEWQG